MFKTFRQALKVKEIRMGLLYTFFILVIVRIGCQLPLPATDTSVIKEITDTFNKNDALNFFNAMTVGSFSSMSVFALNITPYITASIIMQLLTIAIPKLEEMQKDGESGRKKINKITRFITVGLAILEAIAMCIGFANQGVFGDVEGAQRAGVITVGVIGMTAGAIFLMWMGERITEKGIGNGISIILLINIVSRFPDSMVNLFSKFVKDASSIGGKILAVVVILFIVIVIVAFVVLLNDGVRKVAVQYSKKVQGRKLTGGNSSFIPIKVNIANVIPVIFAQSLLQFPVVIASFFGKNGSWTSYLTESYWINPDNMKYSIGFLAYLILVFFFAYFYTSITFNPNEISNNMKKQGGFIPGIRPGKPTAEYLASILNYIVLIGAVGLIIVCTIPIVMQGVFNAQLEIGGTSMIIVVGVILETIQILEAKMVVRNYKGFLIS